MMSLRGSWIIEDGWVRPVNTPKPRRQPRVEAVRTKIDRELQAMKSARGEIRRRIAIRSGRVRP
jgi:hypothetical protein